MSAGILALGFPMFSASQRPQVEAMLQDMLTDIHDEVASLAAKFPHVDWRGAFLGDVDFRLTQVNTAFDGPYEAPREHASFLLEAISSGWWAHLEIGVERYGRRYMRIHSRSDDGDRDDLGIIAKGGWEKCFITALEGKAHAHIDVVQNIPRDEEAAHWSSLSGGLIINFAWPLRAALHDYVTYATSSETK